ncbi:RNA polymerase recycling motor HelD [Paenibacillus marinisediminis]
MSTEHQQWQEEQERVDRVIVEIDGRIDHLQQQVGSLKGEVVDIRKEFWEDVTVNLEDENEAIETAASIKQQAELLSERERSHRHAYKQMKTLTRLKQSPYFGRIDFVEEGESSTEQVYLGIASLLDADGMSFLIYDWRAPVSSLYYDYPPGQAQYETPNGTIHGEMELKRQFIIRDGQIRSMFDTGVTIGDELLKEVLGKQADAQMRSIVATIQRDQNRIIRNEHSKLLVVQGAAGSGKTSAALQRVAYLLYRFRGVLSAEHVVLFSPNPMFNHYVSTVLPELGEENMQQVTYQEYLEHRLSDNFTLEDPFSLLEYEHTAFDEPGYEMRMAAITAKSSLDFMSVIRQYANSLGESGMLFKSIKFRGAAIITADRIREQFYQFDTSFSLPNRIEMLKEWLLKELKALSRLEMRKAWVDEELELLDNEDYDWAHKELQRKGKYSEESFDDYDSERNLLARRIVQGEFKPLRQMIKKLQFVDIPAIYRQLFANPLQALGDKLPAAWLSIAEQTVQRLDRRELAYEDATPYLDLKGQIEGLQINGDIRHLFIDEGQDYSPYQFAYLKKMFPRAKMTVLGDMNQAIFTHTGAGNGLSALPALFEAAESETYVLTRSYRSTRPIIEFTRSFMPNGEEIEPFQREGSKPTLTKAADEAELIERIADRIRGLQQEGHRSIAVITKTAAESRSAHEALRQHIAVRLIDKETVSYEQGILVIPSYLAKGVEFDAVIIYDASADRYGRESERKLFYTACTRAMHELHLYTVGEPTPLLGSVPKERYDFFDSEG